MPVHHLGDAVGTCERCRRVRYFSVNSMSKPVLLHEDSEQDMAGGITITQYWKEGSHSKPVAKCTLCNYREDDWDTKFIMVSHPNAEKILIDYFNEKNPGEFEEVQDEMDKNEDKIDDLRNRLESMKSLDSFLSISGFLLYTVLFFTGIGLVAGWNFYIGSAITLFLFVSTYFAFRVARKKLLSPDRIIEDIEKLKKENEVLSKYFYKKKDPEDVLEVIKNKLGL